MHRVTDIQDCKIRIQQQDRAKLYKPADRYHNGSPRFPGLISVEGEVIKVYLLSVAYKLLFLCQR